VHHCCQPLQDAKVTKRNVCGKRRGIIAGMLQIAVLFFNPIVFK